MKKLLLNYSSINFGTVNLQNHNFYSLKAIMNYIPIPLFKKRGPY